MFSVTGHTLLSTEGRCGSTCVVAFTMSTTTLPIRLQSHSIWHITQKKESKENYFFLIYFSVCELSIKATDGKVIERVKNEMNHTLSTMSSSRGRRIKLVHIPRCRRTWRSVARTNFRMETASGVSSSMERFLRWKQLPVFKGNRHQMSIKLMSACPFFFFKGF